MFVDRPPAHQPHGKGNHQVAAAIVIPDVQGNSIMASSTNLSCADVLVAEAAALREGFCQAVSEKIRHLYASGRKRPRTSERKQRTVEEDEFDHLVKFVSDVVKFAVPLPKIMDSWQSLAI
ncbi:hypothetical protein M0R45_001313 [Rubus argutus]|uniref:RNase H type-1 domain-containing protein n=1 Tax=Rubus argutus TaxID=59490 RepID=A0AAW1VND3_RUBAR